MYILLISCAVYIFSIVQMLRITAVQLSKLKMGDTTLILIRRGLNKINVSSVPSTV